MSLRFLSLSFSCIMPIHQMCAYVSQMSKPLRFLFYEYGPDVSVCLSDVLVSQISCLSDIFQHIDVSQMSVYVSWMSLKCLPTSFRCLSSSLACLCLSDVYIFQMSCSMSMSPRCLSMSLECPCLSDV